jgi:hypothetical protein
MSEKRPPISAELRPFVDRAEADEIDAVAERLRDARPHPDPEFREGLGRALSGRRSPVLESLTGGRLRLTIAGLGTSGVALILVSYLMAR